MCPRFKSFARNFVISLDLASYFIRFSASFEQKFRKFSSFRYQVLSKSRHFLNIFALAIIFTLLEQTVLMHD